MHHIKPHDNKRYFTCGMPNGDNVKSTVVFNDSEFIKVEAYTRNIEDKYGRSDLISLISFVKNTYFTNSIKWLCEILGLDYYEDLNDELPLSLQWTKMIQEMNSDNDYEEDNVKLKPISEKILSYYKPYVNDMFKNDGINYETQRLFEDGYDDETNRITLPIRDELNTLVGVKGRLFKEIIEEWENKYLYLEPCAKNKILYGLNITMPYIKEKRQVIVVEAEKGVQQLFSNGIYNAVAIGCHKLSKNQIEKLIRLNIDEIVIAYDEDAYRYKKDNNDIIKKSKEEFLEDYIQEINKIIPQQKVTVMIDIDGTILNLKQSPSDDMKKFRYLYEHRINLRDDV